MKVLSVIGSICALLLLWLVNSIATTKDEIIKTNVCLAEYKLEDSKTNAVLDKGISLLNNSYSSIERDMIDVKASNQNVILTVNSLERALTSKGLLAEDPKLDSILLVRDYETKLAH